ncbi:hypothetical protein GDO78_020113 [Eleutherodactylus coqui]|uniref:Uncharacterized protein n=1 Tax=Eleutherodactylus coqui TaxID=57060 RepID=A0A8J6BIL4_ELECQ|nr:hypothetical protein GDO78_020113 [Eleutherodactylus coqui]
MSQTDGTSEGWDLPGVHPAHPAVLPAPKEAEDLDLKLPQPPPLPQQQKPRRPNKRGPPNPRPLPDKSQKLEDNEQRPDEAENNQPVIR